jgi:hypothetical protein
LVQTLVRPENHSLSLLKEIYVEEGCHDDWMELHALHYKAENLGIWPRYFRCKLGDQLIGVGVMTVPRMNLAGRNDYFVHMKPNEHGRDSRLINRHRAVWLNKYSCTNSRLVLDTMYRGVGIAYRMQNIMMRMSRYKVIEFQSSMSRFNPFAQKAGIVFTPPKRSTNYESGLKWFRRWFESVPSDFVGVFEEFNALPPKQYEKCLEEMRTFYFKHSSMEKMGDNRMKGRDRVDALAPAKLLKNLQQLVFAFPLYGVYINPDADRTDLPERIPISAFDRHRLDEPLDLNILAELSKGVC